MQSLIGLVVVVLDIIAIVDVVKSAMDPGKKTLWVIGIVILPVVGMIAYFLVGKKK